MESDGISWSALGRAVKELFPSPGSPCHPGVSDSPNHCFHDVLPRNLAHSLENACGASVEQGQHTATQAPGELYVSVFGQSPPVKRLKINKDQASSPWPKMQRTLTGSSAELGASDSALPHLSILTVDSEPGSQLTHISVLAPQSTQMNCDMLDPGDPMECHSASDGADSIASSAVCGPSTGDCWSAGTPVRNELCGDDLTPTSSASAMKAVLHFSASPDHGNDPCRYRKLFQEWIYEPPGRPSGDAAVTTQCVSGADLLMPGESVGGSSSNLAQNRFECAGQWLQTVVGGNSAEVEFTRAQLDVLQAIWLGRDVLAVLSAGSGKSVLYQIPPLMAGGVAVVVSPLLALMQEQSASLLQRGVGAVRFGSDMSKNDWSRGLEDLKAGRASLAYVSPECLVSSEKKGTPLWCAFRQLWRGGRLTMLAVDEAHCVDEWSAWRRAYLQLGRLRLEFPGVPVLALTATAPPATAECIRQTLRFRDSITVRHVVPRWNLHLSFRAKPALRQLVDDIVDLVGNECGLVYVQTRKETVRVANHLARKGVKVEPYHAGLPTHKRQEVLEAWMRGSCEPAGEWVALRRESGYCNVLVCTSAFSFGIHKDNVAFVCHIGLPSSLTQYVQEIGRCGRGGGRGTCTAWFRHGTGEHSKSKKKESLAQEQARNIMLDFAVQRGVCRHVALTLALGGNINWEGKCQACDNCTGVSTLLCHQLSPPSAQGKVFPGGDLRGVRTLAHDAGTRCQGHGMGSMAFSADVPSARSPATSALQAIALCLHVTEMRLLHGSQRELFSAWQRHRH